MANKIKLKRGSGSDPSASDLEVGELAIRTDSGKIFTKKDNGNVAEISGGGGIDDGDKGDITVSNGGDTFTINNGAVTGAKIADFTITNQDVNVSAAIAGTKISPIFGGQKIITDIGIQIDQTNGSLFFGTNSGGYGVNAGIGIASTNNYHISGSSAGDMTIAAKGGERIVFGTSGTANNVGSARLIIKSDGTVDVAGNLDVGSGLDVSGNISVTGTVDGRDVASDGSKLDGIESGATADQTATEVLNLIKTVDGPNSGLYADYAKTLVIIDTRNDGTRVPNDYDNHRVSVEFTNQILNGWHTALTVKGWTDGYAPWQLVGRSDVGQDTNLRVRFGHGSNNTWSSLYKIWHEGSDGSGSGLDADKLDAQEGSYYTNASNLNAGTVAAARLDTATTQSAGNSTTKIATTAFVSTAISNLIDSSPSTLNTLNELAAALGDDANFSTTVTNSIATKLALSGGTVTGQLQLTYNNQYPLNINGSDNGKIVLQGSNAPYIRFKEGTTDKAYIQWNNDGYLELSNDETSESLRISTGTNGLKWVVNGTAYKTWNEANDGSGSGLDADTLDGVQGASFLRSDADDTATGTLTTRDIKLSAGYHLQRSNHHSGHLEGSYNNVGDNSQKSNPIYTIGSSYNPNDADLGTQMYGIGYTHRNASFISSNIPSLDSWGLYIAADGDSRVFLSGTSGNIWPDGVYGRLSHHKGHLQGTYNNVGDNSTKSNPIYTIGGSYNPNEASLSDMYGVGYTHSNASFISFTGASAWGFYVAADGDARVWLGGSNGVISSTGQHYVGSNVVWNAGNDGSGSGLDADLLDGLQRTGFVENNNNTGYILKFGSGGNSGHTSSSYPYAIFQEGGAWSSPYPDLRINYHTGIVIAVGYSGYGGLRFQRDYNDTTELMSIGNGDHHVRVANNLYVNGDIIASGGGSALSIQGGSDIRLASGAWTGDHYGKIQHHSNNLYLSGGSSSNTSFIFRYNNADQIYVKSDGTFWPATDSSSDLGTSSKYWANVYADTYYGDGSNLTGINTDLVSDSSPQLGGLLDGNGQTANFTGNTTGLGLPRGTTAQQPTASSYEGYIRYDNDDNVVYYSDGTAWKKVSSTIPILTSIDGLITNGAASTLTLTGSGFLADSLTVNFSASGINANVTVTASSNSAATVTVPAAAYNASAGTVIAIKVTNADGNQSGTIDKTNTLMPTGGNITTSGSYRIHTFTSSGTFGLTIAGLNVEYLVVAGGGGGGAKRG